MRRYELNAFIIRPPQEVYEHLAEPINMIGLQPLLTTIDVLKEQTDASGIVLRPFHMLITYRWFGLPILRNPVYVVLHLTKPFNELELHVFSRPRIHVVFEYRFQETKEGHTHLIQTLRFERVNQLFKAIVLSQANKTQRALLANLKIRLEKS
jgi:hypothetical protein